MSFKHKLIITYTILILCLVSIFSMLFTENLSSLYKEKAKTDQQALCEKMSKQLDEQFMTMDFFSYNLLFQSDIRYDLQTLASADRLTESGLNYVNDALNSIQKKLFTYSYDKYFFRVTLFNDHGDVLTSEFKSPSKQHFSETDKNSPAFSFVNTLGEKNTLIPLRKDPWAVDDPQMVFSLARSMRSSGCITYLEIQRSKDYLDNIFYMDAYANSRVLALTNSGEVFYSNIEDESRIEYYSNIMSTMQPTQMIEEYDPALKSDVLLTEVSSEYTNIKILLIQDTAALQQNLKTVTNLTIIMIITIIMASLFYIYFFTNRLTKPMQNLKKLMDTTQLSNLSQDIAVSKTHDEFKAINDSYSNMLSRLNESIIRESKLLFLNAQANFDSLQAQVNPHFIFNILNIISQKGMETENDVICNICDCLAAMLTYSTNTKIRMTTIRDEIAYIENYIYLLKQRLEHKLEYSICIEESILNQRIPKISLQQFVENCFSHGFEKSNDIVKIDIQGYMESNWWYIMVKDNGQGFSNEAIESLRESFAHLKSNILSDFYKPDLEIGGLGLKNIYARMLLMYRDNFVFEISNTDTGSKVILGAKISEEEL